jgi:hypothetical protein
MALETFRPSEIEVYQTENQGSESEELTPAFNELTRSGIFFRSAWSSGTITATGQEALWCGAPSGLTTSLMRFQTHLNVTCIPDLVHVAGGRSLWIHNGEQRFDNQGSFWRRHHVDRIISSVDFPPGTPGGSWGLSDLALAHKAVKEIAEARRNPDAKYIAPFILTVANHIPWDLPADAPDRIKEMTAEESPNLAMWRTTAYTDAAIKLFVEELKKQQLWDRTILVLASDHGNLEPGRSPPERRQSQIALLITGGITQRILFESGKTANIEIQHPVGQTGVANLIRHIIGETPEVAEKRLPDILAWPNWWPAISDQNEILFIPGLRQEEDLTLDKRKLVPDAESNLRNDLDNTRLERASLIYRGILLR